MNPTSKLDNNLTGKINVPRLVNLDVRIRFDLWKNNNWLDPTHQLEYLNLQKIIKQHNVGMLLSLNNDTIFEKSLDDFGTHDIHYQLSDELDQKFCLKIDFSNLDKLPVRDHAGFLISGMFEIEYINLQDINITSMLTNTIYGQDTTVEIDFSTPVWSWLTGNWPKILPGRFKLLMEDIENYNKKNLLIGYST